MDRRLIEQLADANMAVVAKLVTPLVESMESLSKRVESLNALVDGLKERTPERGEKGDAGERGEKGDQGDQGVRGDDGNHGRDGEPGAIGEKGEPGEKGDRGDPGERGAEGGRGQDGERGEKGEAGDKGEAGEKGEKGDPGESGQPGNPGSPGEKGERGEKGELGPSGNKGDRGDAGEQGLAGARGEKGDKGDHGDKGDPGRDGRDAADLSVLKAFIAEEAGRRLADAFKNIEVVEEGENWVFKIASGDISLAKPNFYRGIWQDDVEYRKGQEVTWDGSRFTALEDSLGERPTTSKTFWQCSVKRGQNGRSAYDIALREGFRGSEKDWLASLRGEKGDIGQKGDVGPRGFNA